MRTDSSCSLIPHSFYAPCNRKPFFPDMRKDVQDIFKMTPHDKQVMMFSATLSKETGVRGICKKFMQDVITHSPSCTSLCTIAQPLPG